MLIALSICDPDFVKVPVKHSPAAPAKGAKSAWIRHDHQVRLPVDKKTLQRFLKVKNHLTPAISPLWMNSAMPSASPSRLTLALAPALWL